MVAILFLLITLFASLKFRIYGTGLVVLILSFIISMESVEKHPFCGLLVVVSLAILFQRLSVREMKTGRFLPDSNAYPVRTKVVRWLLISGIICRLMITVLERGGWW